MHLVVSRNNGGQGIAHLYRLLSSSPVPENTKRTSKQAKELKLTVYEPRTHLTSHYRCQTPRSASAYPEPRPASCNPQLRTNSSYAALHRAYIRRPISSSSPRCPPASLFLSTRPPSPIASGPRLQDRRRRFGKRRISLHGR